MYLLIDIGNSTVVAAIANDNGEILTTWRFDTIKDQTPDYFIDNLMSGLCAYGIEPSNIDKTAISSVVPEINGRFVDAVHRITCVVPRFFSITDAERLLDIDVDFPLGKLVCVTGVSGSGKSTLVNEILYKTLQNYVYKSKVIPGKCDKVEGLSNIDKVVMITQDAIGRTPRSNPATYVGVFDDIRDLFTNTKEAKIKGYDKGKFSFNVKGGRCEACQGDGVKKI